VDGDGKPDLAVIDRSSKRLTFLGNSDWSGTLAWPPVYAVGAMPKGIGVLDCNGDGRPDIAVANAGSSTVSILYNRGDGTMGEHQSLTTSEKPVAINALAALRGIDPVILASHASAERISIIRLAANVGMTSVSAVPTGPNPHVVLAKIDSTTGHVEMLVRNSAAGSGSFTLSLFQQISGGQLIEKSLRSNIPGRIAGLTVGDFSGRGMYDLLFLTQEKLAKQTSLSIALPSTEFEFKSIKHLFTFADSSSGLHALVPAYLDEDLVRDLIVVLPSPRNELGLIYGMGGGQFKDSLEMIRGAQPLNEDAIIVRDVNNDGHPDVTWIDGSRNAVVTSYGRGNHRFDPPVTICPANRITAIQVASLRKPAVQDLILANGVRGTVSIMFDPFTR
jgi:hypothetical protein